MFDTGKSSYRILLLSLFIFVIISSKSIAEDGVQKNSSDIRPSGPYCGLYCLYAIMELEGLKTDFRQLVKPEYLGSKKGSSLAELKKAAQNNGLYAQVVKNLTAQELKTAKYPVILHVKRDNGKKEYDHYVLFLGDKGGKAKIFDPPNPIEARPYYELAPIWDGTGLIVSTEPINLAKIFAPARKRFVVFATIAIAAILLIRAARNYLMDSCFGSTMLTTDRGNDSGRKTGKISRQQMNFGLSIIQAAGLTAIALLGGMVEHFTNDAGFLARAGATESIVSANIETFIPKVNADEVQNLIGSGAVIVDARQSEDFEAGHIENAVNIPTTLCKAGRESKLAGKDKNSQILIYCQSKGCGYAAKVAANLADDGFKNISIYKNGWVDWQEQTKK